MAITSVRDRVRVLRVIARLNVGGPALHATLLTQRLDPTRYESTLVAGSEEPSEGSYLQLRGLEVSNLIRLRALGREIRGVRDLGALLELIGIIRRVRPDIVHTHTAKAGTLGRLAAWWCGVPAIVHTYHGHVFKGYFSSTRSRAFVAIERWLARRTDRLVAVSDVVRNELLELGIGVTAQYAVVPLGLELDRFVNAERSRGQLRAELGIPADVPLVGIVARLVPIKAHEVFLRAAAILAAREAGARFLIVGDGERRAELEALSTNLGLDRSVEFLGWRPDLDRVYADLDLVVLCSRNEGLPVALIEAQAAGRPVIATRVGGVPDLVVSGDTGLLVPPDDPDALARAIQSLLDDVEMRDRLGRAGRRRVVPAYNAERLLEDIDLLYRELARHGPRLQPQ